MNIIRVLQGDDRKAMLAVQSLRNAQMVAIFTASTAIAFILALAALTNNAYNASHLLVKTSFFGLQSGRIFALKYGLASFLLLFSLLCSSMATGFMIDAIFLLNGSADQFSPSGITQILFERGYMLAFMGNRLLCFSFPLLLWLFGPVPVALSSLALVWWLKELDFVGKFTKSNMIA